MILSHGSSIVDDPSSNMFVRWILWGVYKNTKILTFVLRSVGSLVHRYLQVLYRWVIDVCRKPRAYVELVLFF